MNEWNYKWMDGGKIFLRISITQIEVRMSKSEHFNFEF